MLSKEYYIENRGKILTYKKKHYLENKERILEYKKKYYNRSNKYGTNREEILKKVKEYQKKHLGYCKLWYEKNREKKIEYSKQWREKNPPKKSISKNNITKRNLSVIILGNREYHRQYKVIRKKTDPKFYLNYNISAAIRKSLNNNKAGRHWEDLTGYTLKDLIKRLKKTIPKGYNWKDFLEGKFHIDHIIPISAFNFTESEHIDFQRCWALSNLQLLPVRENLLKGNHLIKPFQPALKF